jgi:hypothetical protein
MLLQDVPGDVGHQAVKQAISRPPNASMFRRRLFRVLSRNAVVTKIRHRTEGLDPPVGLWYYRYSPLQCFAPLRGAL